MAWQHELEVLSRAIKEAGEAVLRIAEQGFDVNHKENTDPVTTADLEANRILQGRLEEAFPSYAWLSEETMDSHERLDADLVWIVDPIDGTKEFVEGVPQYAVSVALVKAGLPVVGAVYNPMTTELFTGIRGEGAWLGGERLDISAAKQTSDHGKPVVLGSRSEMRRGEFAPFETKMSVEAVGSIAYKLALVAAGKADATFSLGPKHEWDIAAGVLLVEAAGGRTSDKHGTTFTFNRPNTLVDSIVGTAESMYEPIMTDIGAFLASR